MIPDVCADIMFTARGVFFSGVSGEPFTGGEDGCAFGIRFYAWSAWLFADDTLRGTQDGCFEAAAHFGSAAREVFPLIPAFSMAIMRSGYHAASILSMILT